MDRAERLNRTAMLLSNDKLDRLLNSRVAVFGIGGVGSACAEALARGGIGHLDLIDGDTVSGSNLNRQIVSLLSNIGQKKVLAMRDRIRDLAGDVEVTCRDEFYLPESGDRFDLPQYDYVVDAIDMVTAKIDLIVRCDRLGVPIISSMGTGNRIDPAMLKTGDLFSTKDDPLARIMRHELRKRGVERLKVLYSEEIPMKPLQADGTPFRIPGSTSFVPPAAGMIIAGQVIRDLCGLEARH